jgi:hypothetical protein
MPLDKSKVKEVKRKKEAVAEEEPHEEPKPVSQGSIEKVLDFIFNPSEEKIREVTTIDRIQAKWLPQLDVANEMWDYLDQIVLHNYDTVEYERQYKKKYPIAPNIIRVFTYRTAQWQKSIGGANMKAGIDLALAEQENKANEYDDNGTGYDPYKD